MARRDGIFDAPIDRLQRDHLEVRMPLEQDQYNILSDLLSVVTRGFRYRPLLST